MNESPKIPIKNIYYMLCYAWNVLEQSDNVLLGSEEFDNIYNLFARIYINGTGSLIKRGFNRYYIQKNRETSTLKGKINIETNGEVENDSTDELVGVLESLGYKTSEIKKVIGNVDHSISLENQVKEALKLLLK